LFLLFFFPLLSRERKRKEKRELIIEKGWTLGVKEAIASSSL
jgi:hypothetical protein